MKEAMRLSPAKLNGRSLDQKPFEGNPNKLLIMTSPRSGSSFLCRLMTSAGLGIPHEYYNPHHAKIIGARLKAPGYSNNIPRQKRDKVVGRYTDALIRSRTMNGVFSVKIQYWQFDRYLRNEVGRNLLAGAAFVHLYRRDVLGQAISLHQARISGKWTFDKLATRPKPKDDPANVAGVDRALNDLLNEDLGWRRLFAVEGIKPLELAYEDLVADADLHLQRIADHAGFEGDLKFGYSEPHEPSTPGTGFSRKEIRQRFHDEKRLDRQFRKALDEPALALHTT